MKIREQTEEKMNKEQQTKNEIAAALEKAKADIYDNKENGNAAFVIAFANQFLQDAKAGGKEFDSLDCILHGSLIGYALKIMNDEKEKK